MEIMEKRVLTDLQRDPERMAEMREKIKMIGTRWVAKAAGYNEQTISNYVTLKRGVEKLENAIIENLPVALKLKIDQQQRDADAAWRKLNENMDLLRKEKFSSPVNL